MAAALLKRNRSNRKLRDYHAARISRLIAGGRWQFNGDTVKLDLEGGLLDGQHRLHAIIKAQITVPLVVVYGIERKAFSTIDTMRVPRSHTDVVYLSNASYKYHVYVGIAVGLLCRWDRGIITERRGEDARVENDEIESKLTSDPGIIDAVAKVQHCKSIIGPGLLGFFYYLLQRGGRQDIGERLVNTLLEPGQLGIRDPYVQFRQALMAPLKTKRRDTLHCIALFIKATNAAVQGKELNALFWHGANKLRPEKFPELEL
jgi:hypothetical protein